MAFTTSNGRTQSALADINITPLVDVVLGAIPVLLMIAFGWFIVLLNSSFFEWPFWIGIIVPSTVLLAAAVILWRLRMFPSLLVPAGFLFPYSANLLICTIFFNPIAGGTAGPGFYVALPVLVVCLLECTLLSILAFRRNR